MCLWCVGNLPQGRIEGSVGAYRGQGRQTIVRGRDQGSQQVLSQQDEGASTHANLEIWVSNICITHNSEEYELTTEKFENLDLYKQKASSLQEDDKHQAANILLQRLIRGRAMQNVMYEGKEKVHNSTSSYSYSV